MEADLNTWHPENALNKRCLGKMFACLDCHCLVLKGTCKVELKDMSPSDRAAAIAIVDWHERQVAETKGCPAGAYSSIHCICATRPRWPDLCPFRTVKA